MQSQGHLDYHFGFIHVCSIYPWDNHCTPSTQNIVSRLRGTFIIILQLFYDTITQIIKLLYSVESSKQNLIHISNCNTTIQQKVGNLQKRYSNSRCQKYVFVYEIFDKRQKRTTLANTKCTLVVCIEEEMISPNYFLLS